MNTYIKPLFFIITCELVGIIGAFFTTDAIPNWYLTLNKPFFSPPNWIFGPVWTILYAMMGIAAFLIYEKGLKKKEVRIALYFFAAQLFFNFWWSIIFFGMRNPVLALVDIIIMWVLIVTCIIKFKPLSKTAAYLLIPYLLWVSFATVLNGAIVVLN